MKKSGRPLVICKKNDNMLFTTLGVRDIIDLTQMRLSGCRLHN
jgi:hypothetical protein